MVNASLFWRVHFVRYGQWEQQENPLCGQLDPFLPTLPRRPALSASLYLRPEPVHIYSLESCTYSFFFYSAFPFLPPFSSLPANSLGVTTRPTERMEKGGLCTGFLECKEESHSRFLISFIPRDESINAFLEARNF